MDPIWLLRLSIWLTHASCFWRRSTGSVCLYICQSLQLALYQSSRESNFFCCNWETAAECYFCFWWGVKVEYLSGCPVPLAWAETKIGEQGERSKKVLFLNKLNRMLEWGSSRCRVCNKCEGKKNLQSAVIYTFTGQCAFESIYLLLYGHSWN